MMWRGKKTITNDNDFYRNVSVVLPKGTYDILKAKSMERRENVSKMIAVAIDNELGTENPFNFFCKIPTGEYIEDVYLDEAFKIYKYMKSYSDKNAKSGIGLDRLVLARRDIGISDIMALLNGMRELLEKKQIERYRPLANASYFRSEDYYRIRTDK
jgi:hypothetical protein